MVALVLIMVMSVVVARIQAKPLDKLFSWLAARKVQTPSLYSNVLIAGTTAWTFVASMITVGVFDEVHPIALGASAVLVYPILIRTIRALRVPWPDPNQPK